MASIRECLAVGRRDLRADPRAEGSHRGRAGNQCGCTSRQRAGRRRIGRRVARAVRAHGGWVTAAKGKNDAKVTINLYREN